MKEKIPSLQPISIPISIGSLFRPDIYRELPESITGPGVGPDSYREVYKSLASYFKNTS